jgi:hypothetical protein
MGFGAYDRDDVKVKGDDGTDEGKLIGTVDAAMKMDDVARTSALYAELTVGTSAVELKVGASALANRKYVTMRPKDNTIYFGFSNAVTSTTGMKMFKDEFYMLPVGVAVWLIADGASKKISIGELS